jgi:hypothetical protein
MSSLQQAIPVTQKKIATAATAMRDSSEEGTCGTEELLFPGGLPFSLSFLLLLLRRALPMR